MLILITNISYLNNTKFIVDFLSGVDSDSLNFKFTRTYSTRGIIEIKISSLDMSITGTLSTTYNVILVIRLKVL